MSFSPHFLCQSLQRWLSDLFLFRSFRRAILIHNFRKVTQFWGQKNWNGIRFLVKSATNDFKCQTLAQTKTKNTRKNSIKLENSNSSKSCARRCCWCTKHRWKIDFASKLLPRHHFICTIYSPTHSLVQASRIVTCVKSVCECRRVVYIFGGSVISDWEFFILYIKYLYNFFSLFLFVFICTPTRPRIEIRFRVRMFVCAYLARTMCTGGSGRGPTEVLYTILNLTSDFIETGCASERARARRACACCHKPYKI